jgi:hypothetical protein
MSASARRKTTYPTQDGMPSAEIASVPNLTIFQVRRPDTLQFGSIEGLTRMAGVPRHRLRRLIVKEAIDNSLDECDRLGRPGEVTVEREGDHYVVEDQGGGIPGDAAVLADLFSTSRAMLSAKFMRRPERGALGNGLRCLVAAVALSNGTITVEAHGRRNVLRPRRVGETQVVEVTASTRVVGTRLEYTLAEVIPPDDHDLINAEAAIELAHVAGPAYSRRPSPNWLDANHLFETFATIEPQDATVRQVIERLDGCTGAMAGKLALPFGKNRLCRDLSESEAHELLRQMQAAARVVKPRSLGLIGPDAFGAEYDGYIVGEAALRVGAHEPYGRIPVLIEAWASVTSRRGGDAFLGVFCNRTPAVGGVAAVRSSGGRIHLSGAGMSQPGATMNVEGGDCDLIVAVTAPLIPTSSLGKAPDLSLLQDHIAETLRRAFNKSRNRLPPDPSQPKPPKAEPLPKRLKPPPYEPSGPLATMLAVEAEDAGVLPRDLLVLSPKHDPFAETKASRRDAEWFAEQIARFVPAGRVHLRGLYYRCLSAGDVRLPDGARFVGSHKTADLIENAGKYARHLGLVRFDRIVDERAAPPELYDTEGNRADPEDTRPGERRLIVGGSGAAVSLPAISSLLPTIGTSAMPKPRQPYRICMVGEKTSLGEVLRPIAREVMAELLLATGEVSESHVYGIAARAAADGRRLRILYFADFDPAGWQMPVSIARKLQAHCAREFPDLDVRLIRVALTYDQVVQFSLPDSPIKKGEKRAKAWNEKWGRDQVEIDALAVLRPDLLDRIARAAVAPYFDPTLESRFNAAAKLPAGTERWFRKLSEYSTATTAIRSAYGPARDAVAALNRAATDSIDAVRKAVEAAENKPDLPLIEVRPETKAGEPDVAIFDSNDDFVAATLKLKAIKALAPEDDDGIGEEDAE